MANQLAADERPHTGPASTPAPTITIAANCSASWEGHAVTPAQIAGRSVALLEQAITAAGGIRNLTETSLRVPDKEAPGRPGFRLRRGCVPLRAPAFQRKDMIRSNSNPRAAGRQSCADFPFEMNLPPPPVPMVLRIGDGGQVTSNNDPQSNRQRRWPGDLGYHGSTTPPARGGEGAPPPGRNRAGRLSRGQTFSGQLYELLRNCRAGRYHLRPFVYLPSAEAEAGRPTIAVIARHLGGVAGTRLFTKSATVDPFLPAAIGRLARGLASFYRSVHRALLS